MTNAKRKPKQDTATIADVVVEQLETMAADGNEVASTALEIMTPARKEMSSYAPSTCRAGTARHAAYMAIEAAFKLGATRAETLLAVKQAEIDWHTEQGRTVKGIAPAGWLKLFACQFGGEA